ncbi:MAG: ZIP family metal transporter [Candidatus Gottesmanbacteria bacterium]
MLIWIIIFTFLGSIASLIIAATLLIKKGFIETRIPWLVAFAAGAMLSAAFFDLLPEAHREALSFDTASNFVFFGIVVFFFLERSLLWYHHHACPEGDDCAGTKPTASLIISGDALHNFLDGVTIAASFLVSFQLGTVTALAVFFHEIPHEIGNFGVLLDSGLSKRSALVYNILSGIVAFIGAFAAYYFLDVFRVFIPYLVAFAAGNFIYIAASDLIPELHSHFKKEAALSQTLSFIIGIVLILLTIRIFE